jgi:glycosyltransferase involved in cell wall biosynthesis
MSAPHDRPRSRALFVLPSLRVGGAERVITTILNQLANDPLDLHLALVEREGPFLQQLSPAVTVHDLGVRRALHAGPALRRLVCRLQPDVVLASAFRLNLLTTLLKPALPRRTRLVIREVTILDSLLGTGWRSRALSAVAARAFRNANAIVCQSDAMQSEFEQQFGIRRDRLVTIFNPVDFAAIHELSDQDESPFSDAGPGPHVVGVGRLDPAKGFDRLLQAVPALLERSPDACIWLVGDGPEAASLRSLSRDLNIADRVRFTGMQRNPYAWMKHADLFVLPSRREGLPNALLEATALGCPTVALDHPGGTREIMSRLGQSARIVTDLRDWNHSWFERPAPEVLERARTLTDVRDVADQYRRVLQGDSALRSVA